MNYNLALEILDTKDIDKRKSWTLITNNLDCEYLVKALRLVIEVYKDIFGDELFKVLPILYVRNVSTEIDSDDVPMAYITYNTIYLTAVRRYYLNYIYQFSHELLHRIKPIHYTSHKYIWVEEIFCNAMSLHVLSSIDVTGIGCNKQHILDYIEGNDRRYNVIDYGDEIYKFISDNEDKLYYSNDEIGLYFTIVNKIYPILLRYPRLWHIAPNIYNFDDDLNLRDNLNKVNGMLGGITGFDELLYAFCGPETKDI